MRWLSESAIGLEYSVERTQNKTALATRTITAILSIYFEFSPVRRLSRFLPVLAPGLHVRRTMLRKIRRSRLREVVSYMRGGDPRDEWEFEVGTRPCRFVNGWRSGAVLIVDGVEVARNDQLISVRGREPFVTAEVRDTDDRQRRVDVYLRAIFGVTIHVRIDGIPLDDGFL